MAQRTVHYALAKILIDKTNIKNDYIFILGSLIPDSHAKTVESHAEAHYIVEKDDKKVMDFTKFFNNYKNKILNDDLYLGYYIHLVSDVLYRNFFYKTKNLYSKRNEPNFKEKLYSDYHNLNYLLKEKYDLNIFSINVDDVPNELNLKTVSELENELKLDFGDEKTSELYYLNEELINEFLEFCTDILIKEITSIKTEGQTTLNSYDYWY